MAFGFFRPTLQRGNRLAFCIWRSAPVRVSRAAAGGRAKPKPKRQGQKNDPKHIAAARELRDRYLEEVNTGRMLPSAWGGGKYEVSRQLIAAPVAVERAGLLDAA